MHSQYEAKYCFYSSDEERSCEMNNQLKPSMCMHLQITLSYEWVSILYISS